MTAGGGSLSRLWVIVFFVMKSPSECGVLADVREAIDAIDREIVRLLGRRREYVHCASRFKASEEAVRAADRVAAMLAIRRGWASEENLDPEFIEQLYSMLVDYFIRQELGTWRNEA
jgi:isochorismate pyruvate lyase